LNVFLEFDLTFFGSPALRGELAPTVRIRVSETDNAGLYLQQVILEIKVTTPLGQTRLSNSELLLMTRSPLAPPVHRRMKHHHFPFGLKRTVKKLLGMVRFCRNGNSSS
jgi:hypothetical protein